MTIYKLQGGPFCGSPIALMHMNAWLSGQRTGGQTMDVTPPTGEISSHPNGTSRYLISKSNYNPYCCDLLCH